MLNILYKVIVLLVVIETAWHTVHIRNKLDEYIDAYYEEQTETDTPTIYSRLLQSRGLLDINRGTGGRDHVSHPNQHSAQAEETTL